MKTTIDYEIFHIFDFTSFIKKWTKRKKKMIPFREKNRRKTKQCCADDTCRWNTDSFSSEVEITKGIV